MEYSRIGEGIANLRDILEDIHAFAAEIDSSVRVLSQDEKGKHRTSNSSPLNHIKIINFHCNRISSTDGLPRLQCLTELNLSSNNIFQCEGITELSYLPMLTSLDLSGE